MKPPVLTKREMYARLTTGEFGNTNPSWDGLRDWNDSGAWRRFPQWGVRSKTANDPRTRLNVPTECVAMYVSHVNLRHVNISPMVKPWSVQWEGDVCRSHNGPGIVCSGNVGIEPGSWRTHMLKPRLWEGTRANALLRQYLNENSYDDLMTLLDEYHDHVIEFSALDYCFGTVPGRNAVVWECRKY